MTVSVRTTPTHTVWTLKNELKDAELQLESLRIQRSIVDAQIAAVSIYRERLTRTLKRYETT